MHLNRFMSSNPVPKKATVAVIIIIQNVDALIIGNRFLSLLPNNHKLVCWKQCAFSKNVQVHENGQHLLDIIDWVTSWVI